MIIMLVSLILPVGSKEWVLTTVSEVREKNRNRLHGLQGTPASSGLQGLYYNITILCYAILYYDITVLYYTILYYTIL